MTKATHAKRIFTHTSRSQLLRDLADFCEVNSVDGPIMVEYDLGADAFMATVFFLPAPSEAAVLIENLMLSVG